jgi:hypothetical protein
MVAQANKKGNIFADFFKRYFHDGEGLYATVTPMNLTVQQVTNPQFYDHLRKNLVDLYPGEVLLDLRDIEASFAYMDVSQARYTEKDDLRYEDTTEGLLIVRVFEKICTFAVYASHNKKGDDVKENSKYSRIVILRSMRKGSTDSSYNVDVDPETEKEITDGLRRMMPVIARAFINYPEIQNE